MFPQTQLLVASAARREEVEASLASMEQLATQQMKSLARESEDALETAQQRLHEVHAILNAYQRFVKVGCHSVFPSF